MEKGFLREAPSTLTQEPEQLSRSLKEKDQQVENLRAQVQQLKAHVQDVHARYEGDVQQTVASLQEQYNAALELMQLGLDCSSQEHSAGALGADGSTAHWRSSSHAYTGARPLQQAQHTNTGTCCKCSKGAGSAGHAGCCKRSCKSRHSVDQRARMLGLNPDDISPAAAYGASVGLTLEPVAVLRDVLNLDGAYDRDRERLQQKPLSAGAATIGVSGPVGSTLAQSAFEARLRGAYRSMLMQLQQRYTLERERQEEAHKMQLQDQAERHSRELRERVSAQEGELARAAKRLEREAAARRLDVQRLESQLMELKVALEASREQAEAARATADGLRAQLDLQRSTHEAELQHVMQGSLTLQQHEEVVRRLKAEWEAALQQRERDYSCLLAELTDLRRQMSSGAPSHASEGSGSYNGPAAAAAAPGTCPQQPAAFHQPPQPQPQRGQPQPLHAAASDRGPQAATWRADAIAQQYHQQFGQQGCRGVGGLAGGRPGSPTPSGHSVALSMDEMGSTILEVSEDTMGATPHSRPAWMQERDPSRPASAASSRLSELVNAVMGSGREQGHGLGAVAETGSANADRPFGNIGARESGSPDRTSSEATFGGWRAPAPGNAGSGRGASPPRPSPRQFLPSGQQRAGALSPRADTRGGAAGSAAAGGRTGRAGSPSSPGRGGCGCPPPAPGANKPSQWGISGNPAAAVNVPKCLRCGLNDATSPGCCRFHPALLSQPGSLMFTPEWMACQAAGHTDRTPGCLVRTEHFYQPLPIPAAVRSRAAQSASAGAAAAVAPSGVGSGMGALRKPGGTAAAAQPARAPPRSRSPRGGSSPEVSPPRTGTVRSRGTVGAGGRAEVRGRGADGAEPASGGDGTPSPRPRTRLPSPLRR